MDLLTVCCRCIKKIYTTYPLKQQAATGLLRNEGHATIQNAEAWKAKKKAAPGKGNRMPLLRDPCPLLLGLPVRVQDLSRMYARKPLGNVLQRHHVGMSGLWRAERIRKSMKLDAGFSILDSGKHIWLKVEFKQSSIQYRASRISG